MKPGDLLRQLRDVKARRVKMLRLWSRGGPRPSCRGRGCNGCCYQVALASIWEGMLIANYLMRTEQTELLREAEVHGDQILDRLGGEYSAEAFAVMSGVWLDERHPCPFLGADGGCQIYALRPVACASYMVVSPPEICSAEAGAEVLAVNNAQALAWAIEQDRRIIGGLLREEGLLVMPLPLGRAVAVGARGLLEGPAGLSDLILGE